MREAASKVNFKSVFPRCSLAGMKIITTVLCCGDGLYITMHGLDD